MKKKLLLFTFLSIILASANADCYNRYDNDYGHNNDSTYYYNRDNLLKEQQEQTNKYDVMLKNQQLQQDYQYQMREYEFKKQRGYNVTPPSIPHYYSY